MPRVLDAPLHRLQEIGGLDGAVAGHLPRRAMGLTTGDVDNHAAPLREHDPHGVFGQQRITHEIDTQHALAQFGGQLIQGYIRISRLNSRIVDQDIQATPQLHRALNRPLAIGLVGRITLE